MGYFELATNYMGIGFFLNIFLLMKERFLHISENEN